MSHYITVTVFYNTIQSTEDQVMSHYKTVFYNTIQFSEDQVMTHYITVTVYFTMSLNRHTA